MTMMMLAPRGTLSQRLAEAEHALQMAEESYRFADDDLANAERDRKDAWADWCKATEDEMKQRRRLAERRVAVLDAGAEVRRLRALEPVLAEAPDPETLAHAETAPHEDCSSEGGEA
jgi:hypothetical protein